MALLKEYKGVRIFVNDKGEFYCNPITNDGVYNLKMFSSVKVASIEAAIDEYGGEDIVNGNQYYSIETHANELKLLTVIRRVGSRLFFDDGTDTAMYSRRELYPKEIDQQLGFAQFAEMISQMKDMSAEIQRLLTERSGITKKAQAALASFRKVKPV